MTSSISPLGVQAVTDRRDRWMVVVGAGGTFRLNAAKFDLRLGETSSQISAINLAKHFLTSVRDADGVAFDWQNCRNLIDSWRSDRDEPLLAAVARSRAEWDTSIGATETEAQRFVRLHLGEPGRERRSEGRALAEALTPGDVIFVSIDTVGQNVPVHVDAIDPRGDYQVRIQAGSIFRTFPRFEDVRVGSEADLRREVGTPGEYVIQPLRDVKSGDRVTVSVFANDLLGGAHEEFGGTFHGLTVTGTVLPGLDPTAHRPSLALYDVVITNEYHERFERTELSLRAPHFVHNLVHQARPDLAFRPVPRDSLTADDLIYSDGEYGEVTIAGNGGVVVRNLLRGRKIGVPPIVLTVPVQDRKRQEPPTDTILESGGQKVPFFAREIPADLIQAGMLLVSFHRVTNDRRLDPMAWVDNDPRDRRVGVSVAGEVEGLPKTEKVWVLATAAQVRAIDAVLAPEQTAERGISSLGL